MSGVHGLAATFGRIPFSNSTYSTMMKCGPIAASAQDAALTLAAIARNAPDVKNDGTAVSEASLFYQRLYDGGVRGPPQPHLQGFAAVTDLSDVRLGVFPQWFADSEPAIQQRCRDAIAMLQRRGAQIVEVNIPHLRVLSFAHAMKISTEFAIGWDAHYYNYPDR